MSEKHLKAIIDMDPDVSRQYAHYTECGVDTRSPNIEHVDTEEEGTCITCAVTRVNHRKEKERKKESEEAKHGDASSR